MTAQLSRERLEEKLLEHIKHGGDSEEETMIRMLLAGISSEPVALQNFRSAMEGIGHIRRTLDETFGGLHGTHCEPDVLVECKAICDSICEAYRRTAPPAPAIPDHMTLIEKGWLLMLERSRQTLLDYRADSVWYWQGDEDDQPESLSCPVIMSAETLRELLAKSAPPAPVAVPDEKWVNPDIGYADENGFAEGWNESRQYAIAKGVTPPVVKGISEYCRGWNAFGAAMLKAGPVTAVTVPDGWKLVPVEPTDLMVNAMYDHPLSMRGALKSAIAAAPAAPEQEV